jgi:hypothetical protein
VAYNLTARLPDLKFNVDLDNIITVVSQAILERYTLLDTNSLAITDTNGLGITVIGVATNTPSYTFNLTARMPDMRLSGDL